MSRKERRRKRGPGVTGEGIKRLIAARVAEAIQEDPERYSKMVELGLVDADAIARLPEDLDFKSAVRQFRDRVAELARTEPSVLQQLEMRPLDVMRAGEQELAASHDLVQVARTVLFSDLEGFTTFTSKRGDLEAGALLADHYDAVDAIVRSRGGNVVKTIGDGHMLSFTEPAAAVMASVDLVEAAPGPLRLRAGAHLGLVVASDTDLVGHVVNVAARVTDLAAGGMSMVTTEVRDAAGRLPRIVFADAESHVVHGLEEPVDVCEVQSAA